MTSKKETSVAKPENLTPTTTLEKTPVFAPRSDIYENAEGFLLVANLPGVSEENVQVSVEKNRLTVEGRAETPDAGSYTLVYGEFRPRAFRRTFALSDEVDVEKIGASLKHGVLRVSLPKREAMKPRTIKIDLA